MYHTVSPADKAVTKTAVLCCVRQGLVLSL